MLLGRIDLREMLASFVDFTKTQGMIQVGVTHWNVIEGLIRKEYFYHFIEAIENARNDERREQNR